MPSPPTLRDRLRQAWRKAAGPLLLAGTAGCGGGIYIEATDYDDGPPPAISLSTSTDLAEPGEVVRLSAAVSASNGLDYVSFYRVDRDRVVRLATVGSPPAQWDTRIPLDAGPSVAYFARACDFVGYCTDSRDAIIDVLP